MSTYADQAQKNKSQWEAARNFQTQSHGESTLLFVDSRPEGIAQKKLQEIVNNSPQVKQVAQVQTMLDHYTVQQQQSIQKKENNTGLPDKLKTGMESLSGISMDDVKVHYNSDKPAQLQAHAYAQGTDIHSEGDEHSLIQSQTSIISTQLMPVIQMVITGQVTVAVTSKRQAKTNTCWAACGWVIDLFKGGNYASEQAFVTAKGDLTAKNNYTSNTTTDIDRIIGSSAVTNRLSASDSSTPFLKSAISRELGSKPIVANVNNNHYIIICGKRFNNGNYQLQYMDPGYGSTTWADTATTGSDKTRIDQVGGYALSVLYYIT